MKIDLCFIFASINPILLKTDERRDRLRPGERDL